MKSKKYLFIKIALTSFLLVYLAFLYTADRANDIPMEEIAASMEQDTDITALQGSLPYVCGGNPHCKRQGQKSGCCFP